MSIVDSYVPTQPDADLCARVALACAGLSGNRPISRAIDDLGSATEVVAACYDFHDIGLPARVAERARLLGGAPVVAAVLRETLLRGLTLLRPSDDCWPGGLRNLKATSPVVLWAGGDTSILLERPLALAGPTDPDEELRHKVIELITASAMTGWTVASSSRHGVDELACRSALAVGGEAVTVATIATCANHLRQVVVSENPPGLPTVLASAARTPILLAAIAGKVLVSDARANTAAGRTALVAHALSRPLGVLGARSDADPRNDWATPVSSLVDLERLN